MKKNTLTTAVVASLAGIAGIANISNAVNLNPDGLGQVLIYPYYTVNGNNQTLISVVNTTNQGKAVKVRILEGHNSREVLDFNLYLSAFDVWTAAIFDTDATGPGAIITNDNTCTVPAIKGNATLPTTTSGLAFKEFVNFAYTDAENDSGPDALERTREGYIELIEMGTIAAAVAGGNPTLTAITHKNGTPTGCADVDAAWQNPAAGYGGGGLSVGDVTAPSGGLFGGGAVVNSADGTYINYNADAIDGYSSATQHTFPGDVNPTLSAANPASFVFDNGRLIASTWGTAPVVGVTGQRIDAVSSVYQSANLLNEFATETSLAGSSEWVITFPTKRFYVDRPAPAIAPFTNIFNRFTGGVLAETGSGACESLSFNVRDREEGTVGISLFSPQPPGVTNGAPLCFESQVLSFNQTITGSGPSRILASQLTRNVNPTFGGGTRINAGWMSIDFVGAANRAQRPSVQGHVYRGLPATGFWAQQIENRNARVGVQGFYAGAFGHRRTRACTIPAAGGANGTGPACAL
jgi:hypothetical protein